MRTTISISDELLMRAKKASVERGCSLGEVIEEALMVTLLARKKPGEDEVPRSFKTFAGGGVRPGVDLVSNASLEDLMDAP
ncbi:MAG: antitoxin [Akkermansiaceae bacterium]|nr:antitoxin [Akkermansiaceae bacterium]MCP5542333.1 antitoxin [Akkermansiaceae bacterium]MCP5546131.1 antitoxin [Akkermansiaceae bacterium]